MSVNQAVAIAVLAGQSNVLQTGPSSGGMQAAAALSLSPSISVSRIQSSPMRLWKSRNICGFSKSYATIGLVVVALFPFFFFPPFPLFPLSLFPLPLA